MDDIITSKKIKEKTCVMLNFLLQHYAEMNNSYVELQRYIGIVEL